MYHVATAATITTTSCMTILSVFFLMVFGCDSLAWFFGMLFGNSNRGMIKASPNKSIAGFAGGYIGAIAAGIAGTYIFTNGQWIKQ